MYFKFPQLCVWLLFAIGFTELSSTSDSAVGTMPLLCGPYWNYVLLIVGRLNRALAYVADGYLAAFTTDTVKRLLRKEQSDNVRPTLGNAILSALSEDYHEG